MVDVESVTKRRPKGEGSFRYRPDKKLWSASFDLGRDEAGARRRRTLYGKSRAELQRKVADLRATGGGSVRPSAKGTVREFVEQWLERDVKPNKRSKTYESYEASWRLHAAQAIGSTKMERFDVEDVLRLYDGLRRSETGSSALRHVAVVMHNVFEVAIKRRAYMKANPFRIVDRPVDHPKDGRALTVVEALQLLEAGRGDRFAALWVLLLTCGLRIGEALALHWDDVDFDNRTLAVRRTATQIRGRVEIGEPKTKRSRRRVDLGTLATDALRARAAAAASELHTSKLVFPSLIGKPMLRSNLYRSHWYPLLKRAGIGHLRIHDLRHTMTSLGVAAGLLPKVLAERLGHSTTRMTEDRYSHVLPGHGAAAAMAIDALLGRK